MGFYWPIFKSSLKEVVNDANLYAPINAQLTSNRFGEANSAIRLTQGYYNLPVRDYFNGDFIVMLWLNKNILATDHERIIDCGPNKENSVALSISRGNSNKLFFQIGQKYLEGSKILEINVWHHVTFVLNGTLGLLYINGTLDSKGQVDVASNVTRNNCYLGRSLWNNPNVNADFDDIKIFKKALDLEQIISEFARI